MVQNLLVLSSNKFFFTLNINQNLIQVYSPQSNPVKHKNRYLKPRLAILVRDNLANWHTKLSVIHFTMNMTICDTTGHTTAYLQFGKEKYELYMVQDFKSVVDNGNFAVEITLYV